MSEARKIGLENKIGKERRKIKEKPGTKRVTEAKMERKLKRRRPIGPAPSTGALPFFLSRKGGRGSKRRSRSQPTSKLKKKTSTNEGLPRG